MQSKEPTANWDSGAAGPEKTFVAIDFETATSERNSACAVGAVLFEEGSPTKKISLLIRPPNNRYDPFNSHIHGIGPSDTKDSPEFPEVWEIVSQLLDNRLVVAHNTAFDISVLRRSAELYGYSPAPFPFACTYRLARSSMPEAQSWKLNDLANEFGIGLSHHDPLSDAEAAGHLWMALPRKFDTTPKELLEHHGYRLGRCDLSDHQPFSNAQPSSSGRSSSYSAKDFTPNVQPDPGGTLFAKKIVFTGALECMPRREAYQATVDAGAKPIDSVSKRTDYLVIGTTDPRKGPSTKHRDALALAAEGGKVQVIDEDQFICLLANTVTSDTP